MFKRWSIKRLLQCWALATVVVVWVIALLANYANSLTDSNQIILAEQVLPLENSSRELSSITTELSNRQQHMLASDSLLMLAQLESRDTIEQRFQQNWLRLSHLLDADEARQSADSLFSYYQDFLTLDSELYTLKKQSLQLKSLARERNTQIRAIIEDMQQQFDVLQNSSAPALANNNHRIYQLHLQLYGLEKLHFQLIDSADDEALTKLINTRWQPQFIELEQGLSALNESLSAVAGMQSRLLSLQAQLQQLGDSVAADGGLYALRQQMLLTQALLTQNDASAMAVMGVLNTKLNHIADSINRHSTVAVNDNVQKADRIRWRIVALGIALISAMLVFTWLLFRTISKPLADVRRSLHELAEGQLDTRMRRTDSKNELSQLAGDFNRLADNTQQLIVDLSEAKQSLHSREMHLRAILNGVPEAILTLGTHAEIIDTNPAAEQVLGADAESLRGQSLLAFFDPQSGPADMAALLEQAANSSEFEGQRLNGSPLSMWLSLSEMDTSEAANWVCVISDVTTWKQTDRRLQQITVELNAILENAIIGIAYIRDRKYIRVNQRFEQLFGYDRDEIIGQSTVATYPNQEAYRQFGEQAYKALESGESYEAQLELVKNNGERFWCAISGKAVDPADPLAGTIWLFEDVTQQRQNEEYLTRLASIDTLTGLLNRNVFNDRVEHALHKAQRNNSQLAVFFLDLDHFKQINDSMGHRAGDNLLVEVASRIRTCLREDDTVARLGGDEFTLLLEDIRSAEYVGKVAEKVLQAVARPYEIESTEVSISPSIGISLYPADGRDVDILIRNADAAMYHAKKLGRNNFQFYSQEMNAEAAHRLSMETALRRAVARQELYLHYQPQYLLDSGELCGAEVLLRWHSDEWGDVSPANFVPILEDTGLIGEVGDWVLRQGCEMFLSMREQLPADFRLAVNLSGRQFKGGGLAGQIRQILEQTGMPPANLELEITETMLMEDTALATATLGELSGMGVSLAIDDFGTGYSSLSYLKQFPLNVLKIDSTFIQDVTSDNEDAAIVDAILAMCERLALIVVAEGVETDEQRAFLQARMCQRAQGYLFSRPLDGETFQQRLADIVSSGRGKSV